MKGNIEPKFLKHHFIVKNALVVLSVLLLFLTFLNCENNTQETENKRITNYLHLAHTRSVSNPAMDSLVETINYKNFDMLWLGGDLAHLTSENNEVMAHIDSIFDFGNPNTLWAIGNHDYTDLKLVRKFTKRPPFYSYHKNGITFIVLDTQDSLSSIVGSQKRFFDNVTDTLQKSSHLIVLHHKLIWLSGNPELEPKISSVSNGPFGGCFFCINPNNFYSEIYPKLLEIKQKGIEVICIGGDIGFKAKSFEYQTKSGIHFLASGISYKNSNKKALLFSHKINKKELSWKFVQLADLENLK